MYIRLLSRELVQLSTTGSSDDTLSSPPQYLAACVAAGGETQVAAAADVPRLERAGRELEEQGFTLIPSVLCATELCALREAMEVW